MKTDLSQATFIIPIRIESNDRLRNVITSICYLLKNFDTNIIVKEVDKTSVFLASALPPIVECCGWIHTATSRFSVVCECIFQACMQPCTSVGTKDHCRLIGSTK